MLRNKQIFIDLVLKIKDLKKSVEELMAQARDSSFEHKSKYLYLEYASLADCDRVIAELDNHIANFNHRTVDQDLLIFSMVDRAMEEVTKRQNIVTKMLKEEERKALKRLEEELRNMFD